jgi:hypothetical protein
LTLDVPPAGAQPAAANVFACVAPASVNDIPASSATAAEERVMKPGIVVPAAVGGAGADSP